MFPPIPIVEDFLPSKEPTGPNIEGLARMSPCQVLERFIPVSFWARVAQETNAYRQRCQQDAAAVDGDDPDISVPNAETNEETTVSKAEVDLFNRDYDIKWKDQSVGSIVTWIGMHIGMCLRPRANQQSYWDPRHIGALRPDA